MIILLLQMKVQGANGSNEEDRKCINQCGCAYIYITETATTQHEHKIPLLFLQ